MAVTRWKWADVPSDGMVSFVDPARVRPTMVHGEAVYGYVYLKAGFRRVEDTKGGLWTYQLDPSDMGDAEPPAFMLF